MCARGAGSLPGVRKLLLWFVVAGLLAACGGGGDDDPSASDDTSSTSSTLAPGSTVTSVLTTDPTASTDTTAAPVITADTTPIDPATIETLPPAAEPPPPADPGFPPPDLGQYAFHTTGGSSLEPQPIDRQTITTVTALGANEVRHSSAEQVLDLQYRPDGVYVRQLVVQMAGQQLTFQSGDGVLFAPIPQAPGQHWEWQLTDTSGRITAAWAGITRDAETITVAGAPVTAPVVAATVTLTGTYAGFPVNGTMRVTLWIDPARRLPVQLHQITTVTQPFSINVDTTSVLTGFTPA